MRIYAYIPVILFYVAVQTDYRTEFTFNYTWAIRFMNNNKKSFIEKSTFYKTDTSLVTSIVFPELIRYSIFKNYFETKGLELIYSKYGKQYADFSIGIFQMKPSFIEMLEKYVAADQSHLDIYRHLITYRQTKERKKRSERIKRLKNFEWQLEYLNCFYSIAALKFSNTEFKNTGEKIKFYATAYNHGLDKTPEEIRKWMNMAVFPYGMKSRSRQYNYSDISLYFYKKEYKIIFNNPTSFEQN